MSEPLSPDTGIENSGTGADCPGAEAGAIEAGDAAPRDAAPPLPDLCEVDLETLRTLDHPVLAAMVADLRERAERPREMLWGFTNAF
ncbi:FxSxx-COOH cyclophane-containing RiPP peptide [Streptomyces sp. NPDC047002]|uniref:FxSxx-COOH cyclophane-containing RiPP peptide n=1 Tax=Streptomyces sp. NPDC047002 TaxID=3155475 RepID=UPI003452E0BF